MGETMCRDSVCVDISDWLALAHQVTQDVVNLVLMATYFHRCTSLTCLPRHSRQNHCHLSRHIRICSSSRSTTSEKACWNLQAAAVDSAAAASKAARAAEHGSAADAVAGAQLELAAYASGTLAYLTQGSDHDALDLSQHVRPRCPPAPSLATRRCAPAR